MKTRDGHEIKKGRIYYRVHHHPYCRTPSIERFKCDGVFVKSRHFQAGASFVSPHTTLASCTIRSEVFHSFEKAKTICLGIIKTIQMDVEKDLEKIESLTKKGLKNER